MTRKNKNRITYSITIIIAGLALFISLKQTNSTTINQFALSDTTRVTKIFLADKNNNYVTLTKTEEKGWMLNDSLEPIEENIHLILKTLINIQIKYPVPNSALNTTIKRLATQHTKVEVYGYKPLFQIFDIEFFGKERLLRTIYVGGPTTDNQGTIMKTENDDQIYVTYIPGFRGYLSERFSPKLADWMSHKVFAYMISDIKSVKVEFPNQPLESYEIVNNQNRTFNLIQLMQNRKLEQYDTIKLLESIAAFNSINYEAFLDNMEIATIDSIKKSLPLRVVTVENIKGEKTSLRMYLRANSENILDYDGIPFKYDVDRLYGFLNENQYPFAMQYFVIDNISRPLSYLIGAQSDTLQ